MEISSETYVGKRRQGGKSQGSASFGTGSRLQLMRRAYTKSAWIRCHIKE